MILPWKSRLGLNFASCKSAKALGSGYRNRSLVRANYVIESSSNCCGRPDAGMIE